MKPGTIVVLPFPFTDLSGHKLRPALVLAIRPADITVAFISSQVQFPRSSDVLVQPSAINGLRVASFICTDKLATIEARLAKGELGELDSSYRAEVNQKLTAALLLPLF
ncbi:type II toxin-antitoxin system PemK/MazF family toxin [Hymenobacter weizhouensis]|uniref:type II toxin-antitoxin system PemK/MazF family toxin n=1 Tax=Hymenobacter sp. YIM 151500-1 TaxID=2987689 RepID=UPI00222791B0|nr:type II toxin-antitoxin system PemK/MazF family toxin [Hymenobacter sp. YIM 151500-1]UYZ62559.1 type II toxin-antitoxin system PemK/MazF family toxin [Hymenobacter sp. YIM 151500-1]